ncbi:MAG: 2-amino-4-hydroxy-6-hydroxymethyldihydropteridine diphosphokinase [Nitrospirales bacterium]
MHSETVFIGFGSNLGDRQELCDRAVALIGLMPHSKVIGVSSYYETSPVDPNGILGDTWFYNGVVKLDTSLVVRKLFDICQETERALGRDDDNRAGPRTMDFDVLFYGQHIIDEADLTIPHPRLHLRRFVLEPLVELDPQWNHPTFDRSLKELFDDLDDSSKVRKLELTPGSRYGNRPTCASPTNE